MIVPNESGVDQRTLKVIAPREFKQFSFEEEILRCVRQAGLSDVKNLEGRFLIFDLTQTQWHDLGTLVWFVSLLNTMRKQKNEIQIVFPEADTGGRVWDFLIRWKFFDALRDCVDDPANLLTPHQIPLSKKDNTRYRTSKIIDEFGQESALYTNRILEITTIWLQQKFEKEPIELNKYYEKVVLGTLSKKCGWDEVTTENFVNVALKSSVRNSAVHSEGNFVNVAMRIDGKNLTVVIADNGIGIPEVLRSTFKQSQKYKDLLSGSDAELIKFFTEPDMVVDSRYIKWSVQGATSRSELKGLGLYYLKTLVVGQGGELRVRSGRGCVDFNPDGIVPRDDLIGSTGTMLRIRTPLK